MLMDEPFGAVDPIVRERLQNQFLRLQEDLAKTILFVTHDIDEAIKMGDLVVVMQLGGKIAQVGAPAELLAEPASEYVARFVGADRGLKRLSLYRVRDVDLEPAPVARVGQPVGELVAEHQRTYNGFVLLMDDDDRPIGWVELAELDPATMLSVELADPMSPLLDRRATLKDATSRLLDEEVRNGVVTDREGRVLGLLTLRSIMDWMRGRSVAGRADDIAEAVSEAVVSDETPTPPVA